MIYAIVENGVVTNTIVLNDSNAQDFPNAVATNGLFVAIGDTYADGQFVHVETVEEEETGAENSTNELEQAEQAEGV